MKVKLFYKGSHQVQKVHEIEEKRARKLVESEDWRYADEVRVKPMIYPTSKWTEKKIKAWLDEHNIPIDYSITNDEKENKLKEIDEYFA